MRLPLACASLVVVLLGCSGGGGSSTDGASSSGRGATTSEPKACNPLDGTMVERPVKNVSRGSTTHVTFDVDGVEHHATFASSMSSHTNSTLTVNGQQEGLVVNTTDPGAGLSYLCL